MKKKILITGGAGYIGSNIALKLIDKNYDVIILDNLSTGYRFLVPKKAKFINCNILNFQNLKSIFKKFEIYAVIHLAASLDVEESAKDPKKYYLNNVIGTENVLKVIKEFKIKNIIFSSTAAVYGNNKNAKVTENSNLTPESNYGKTKLLAEILVKNYSKTFNLNYAILRYFNVVGADENLRTGPVKSNTLFKVLARNITMGKFSINLFGGDYDTKDGTCIRDYIDVNDLANMHIDAMKRIQKDKELTMNCGYGKPLSVLDIINFFSYCTKQKIKILKKKRRKGDIEKIFCDISKQRKLFKKYKQSYSLEQSVLNQIKWERFIKKNAKYIKNKN